MKKIIYSLSLVFTIAFLGCSDSSEDDLVDDMDVSSDKVTYEENIKAIISNNCAVCHKNPPINGASVDLTNFENAKNSVDAIISRISRQPGETGFMPNGGNRIPQNLIDQVIQWKADGLLEN